MRASADYLPEQLSDAFDPQRRRVVDGFDFTDITYHRQVERVSTSSTSLTSERGSTNSTAAFWPLRSVMIFLFFAMAVLAFFGWGKWKGIPEGKLSRS